jgi:excisionase family DNA binding protein
MSPSVQMQPSTSGRRIVSIVGLANYLEISESEVRELIQGIGDLKLPAFKVGNRWFVDLEEVEDWLLGMLDKLEPSD